jgi:hypothetical protein
MHDSEERYTEPTGCTAPKNSAAIWVVSLLLAGWLLMLAGADLQATPTSTRLEGTYHITLDASLSGYVDAAGRLEPFKKPDTRLIFCLPGSDKFC